MSVPSLPDWLPWWAALIVVVPIGLWALTLLIMPFSVIGLKARLEGIDARLDEVQSEIRSLALRLPDVPGARSSYRETGGAAGPDMDQRYIQPAATRPPIPPAAVEPAFIRRPPTMHESPTPSLRAEPRVDWRR